MKIRSNFRSTSVAVLFALVSAGFLFSCGSKSELTAHIPKDANVVVAVDVKSLGYKSLNFNELLSMENVKKALSNIGKKDTTKATNIENSGIDFLSKAYAFGTAGPNPQGGAIVALSDAGKFETFLLDMNKDFKVSEADGMKSVSAEGEKVAIGWTDSYAIAVFGTENPVKSLDVLAKLKKEESLISTNAEFRDLENESSDISFWLSFENLQKYMPANAMAGTNFDFKETFLTASCNFEDGQIAVNTKYTTNEENAKKFAFMRPKLGDNVAKTIPGKGLVGVFSFALDMPALKQYLNDQHLLDMYGASSAQFTGLSPDDLFAMFSGDLAMSLNGMQMKEVKSIDWSTGEEVMRNVPSPDYFGCIGIADKAKLDQLLQHLETSGMLVKKDDHYSFMDQVFVNERDGALMISATSSMKDFAVSGNGDKLTDEVRDLLVNNASAFYVNVRNVPDEFYASASPAAKASVEDSEVEDIIVTGSNPKGKVTTGKLLIRFKNKNENSLVTLTRIGKKFSEALNEAVVASNVDTDAIEATAVSN